MFTFRPKMFYILHILTQNGHISTLKCSHYNRNVYILVQKMYILDSTCAHFQSRITTKKMYFYFLTNKCTFSVPMCIFDTLHFLIPNMHIFFYCTNVHIQLQDALLKKKQHHYFKPSSSLKHSCGHPRPLAKAAKNGCNQSLIFVLATSIPGHAVHAYTYIYILLLNKILHQLVGRLSHILE